MLKAERVQKAVQSAFRVLASRCLLPSASWLLLVYAALGSDSARVTGVRGPMKDEMTPTNNVMLVPISTYHGHAMQDRFPAGPQLASGRMNGSTGAS